MKIHQKTSRSDSIVGRRLEEEAGKLKKQSEKELRCRGPTPKSFLTENVFFFEIFEILNFFRSHPFQFRIANWLGSAWAVCMLLLIDVIPLYPKHNEERCLSEAFRVFELFITIPSHQ